MKKTFLLIIPILFLTGCNGANNDTVVTYCDKKYGVEYLREPNIYGGGITVRLDENGNVIHCK